MEGLDSYHGLDDNYDDIDLDKDIPGLKRYLDWPWCDFHTGDNNDEPGDDDDNNDDGINDADTVAPPVPGQINAALDTAASLSAAPTVSPSTVPPGPSPTTQRVIAIVEVEGETTEYTNKKIKMPTGPTAAMAAAMASGAVADDNSTTPAWTAAGAAAPAAASAATGGASEPDELSLDDFLIPKDIGSVCERVEINPGVQAVVNNNAPAFSTASAAVEDDNGGGKFFLPAQLAAYQAKESAAAPGHKEDGNALGSSRSTRTLRRPAECAPPVRPPWKRKCKPVEKYEGWVPPPPPPKRRECEGPDEEGGAAVAVAAPKNKGAPRSACKCCQTSKSKPHCNLKKTQFRRCSE